MAEPPPRAPGFWQRRRRQEDREGRAPIEMGRLHAFTDGVFAIAATLLVLELRVPELAAGLSARAQEGALLRGLAALWPQLLAFLLSFVLIGRMWVLHSRFTWGLTRADGRLGQLNVLYLITISLLPFSSALLGAHGNLRLGWWVYCLNLILMELCYLRLLAYARQHGGASPASQRRWQDSGVQAWAALAVFVASAGIALWNVTVAECSMLLLIPMGWLVDGSREPVAEEEGEGAPGR